MERLNLSQLIANLGINRHFLTFLIDKKNNIDTENSFNGKFASNLREFHIKFNIPTNIENNVDIFFNFIKNKYYRQQSIDVAHQPRSFGCYHGVDDRLKCPKYQTCDDGARSTKRNKCNNNKGNIWVREEGGIGYRLSNNYISVIKKELLHNRIININLLTKYLYPNDSDAKTKFNNDFNITEDELNAFFEDKDIKLDSIPKTSISLDTQIEEDPSSRTTNYIGAQILDFLKKNMKIK